MTSRATIPAAELRFALAKGGWRIESVQEGEGWCREWWRLSSNWSPQTAEAYLSFLLDPQDSSRVQRIWAVRASVTVQVRNLESEGVYTLPFTRSWRRELPHLIRYLAALRGGVRSNSALLTDAKLPPI